MREASPESLFAARLADDPARPLLTFYDDETGERAELSAKSLANWVAKTHFLLLDEVGSAVGDRAFVSLPVHWLAAPVLFGCWFAGLEVVSSPAGADVAFGDVGGLATVDLSGVSESYAVSLLSMARSAEPPSGMSDYAAAVRPQPDSWAGVHAQARPTDAALDGLSRSDLAASAEAAAAELGLGPGGRLLWTSTSFGPSDWVSALLAPLTVGGSSVLIRHGDPAERDARASSERVSVIH
ncbi:MAG TPA: TIGR03089 family protein [Jatrophihabitans sp.]|jgi:uncharacterized protein (TIGR03089 family)